MVDALIHDLIPNSVHNFGGLVVFELSNRRMLNLLRYSVCYFKSPTSLIRLGFQKLSPRII